MLKDKLPASKEDLKRLNEMLEKLLLLSGDIRERAVHIEDREKWLDEKINKVSEMLDKTEDKAWNALYNHINVKSNKETANYFMAAIPDSLNCSNKFSEYDEIYPMFIGKNRENNIKDFTRFYSFMLNINRILEKNVSGAFAELGVYKGNNSAVMMHYCTKYGRKLYMFDTFEGFDERDLTGIDERYQVQFKDTSLEEVKAYVGENELTRYIKGFFPDSITEECKKETYAFVSLDCDLYAPIKAGLEFFYPRLSKGGLIFIHDYSSGGFEGCTKAVDEFCEKEKVSIVLLPDKSGTAVLSR